LDAPGGVPVSRRPESSAAPHGPAPARAGRGAGALGLAAAILLSPACGPGSGEPLPLALEARILEAEDRRDPEAVRPPLSDERPAVRARACVALGRTGAPAALDPLLDALGDPDAGVRAAAAFGLGLLEEPFAAPALREALAGPDAGVRAAAARALAQIDHPDAAPALARVAREEAGEPARQALYGLWRRRDPATLDAVLARTSDADAELRRAAAYCLMRMAGPPSVGATPVPGGTELSAAQRAAAAAALRRLSADGDDGIRELAARGLGGPDLPGAGELLAGMLADPSWRVRVNVLRSLAGRGGKVPAATIAPCLDHGNPNVRLAALGALAAAPADAAVEARVEELLRAPEASFRAAAAAVLVAWRGDAALPLLQGMAGDSDPRLRAAAAGLLAAVPGPEAEATLRRMLDDWPVVALAALPALAGRRGADSLAVAREGLRRDDAPIRAAALDLLPAGEASLGTLRAAWRAARDDPQNDARVAALRKAAAIDGEAATALLEEIFGRDPDWLARRMAATELRRRGRPEADAGPLETGHALAYYETALRESRRPRRVVLTTERGEIAIELLGRAAPLTVRNFASLVESGYFDGLPFHRVVPNFVVQGGDPRGDGSGGPGWQIRCELSSLPYERGTVGMALDGRDTGGSQFFITHSPQPHLEGRYTVFGRVVAGMDVVDAIVQGDRILRARVEEAPG
jgi:cyclophilin family peptidyl-prolyl cis-trans isomerase